VWKGNGASVQWVRMHSVLFKSVPKEGLEGAQASVQKSVQIKKNYFLFKSSKIFANRIGITIFILHKSQHTALGSSCLKGAGLFPYSPTSSLQKQHSGIF